MLLGGTERRTRFAGGQEWPQRAGYLYKLEERVGRTGLLDSADEHTRGDEKNTGFFSYVCMYVCGPLIWTSWRINWTRHLGFPVMVKGRYRGARHSMAASGGI